MDRFFHVARTYWRRPRFWVFGGWYLLLLLGMSSPSREFRSPAVLVGGAVSVVLASLVMTFIALHVRRQFGTSQAHLTPGFAGPHLTVAAFLTLLVWVGVPWIEALRLGTQPAVMISLHAYVAILMAVVIAWPRMSVILIVAPTVMIWGAANLFDRSPFPGRFAQGQTPTVYAALIALGVISYGLAAWRLMRLSDVTVATSDDFTIEPPGSTLASNPVSEIVHKWRDAHIEWRLGRRGLGNVSFQRRQVPSAPSWPQMACFAALTLALVPLMWWAAGDPIGGWLIMTVLTASMLFAPFSFWRFRANALAVEVMRPATRRSAVREVMLAMAADFCLWGATASITVLLTCAALWGQDGFEWAWAPAVHLAVLWSMGLLLLGIGVATLRFHFWIPLFAGLLVVSVVAVFAATASVMLLLELSQWRRSTEFLPLILFPAGFATIGLVLCAFAYRRWREMDIA